MAQDANDSRVAWPRPPTILWALFLTSGVVLMVLDPPTVPETAAVLPAVLQTMTYLVEWPMRILQYPLVGGVHWMTGMLGVLQLHDGPRW